MEKYNETFWAERVAASAPSAINGTLLRMVENQEQIVTTRLVDTLDEQALLEELLENSKPDVQWDLSHLHDYLLRTPWRYPPLHWGSRFGRRFEPSLFYGSLDYNGLLAEIAYYRWVFLSGMSSPFEDRVVSQHTVFTTSFKTDVGYRFDQQPFLAYSNALTCPDDYSATQALGSVLRENNVAAFIYFSARSNTEALNVALLNPAALVDKKHRNPVQWICQSTAVDVSFKSQGKLIHFDVDDFLVDGVLPIPA